ncbi:glycoside hydrolase family 97 protein [Persicobacter diffluens]|uniref:Alpha-glucosidase n=1 Tax=Persicobacter diffluens TaxID=981 RepID=A0AAN4W1R7_9BACT|nr:alpha-glucosidase [Persicobacter diffluens]
MRSIFLSIITACAIGMSACGEQQYQVNSPDDQLSIGVIQQDDAIKYFVLAQKDTLVYPSALGLKTSNGQVVAGNIVDFQKHEINESYPLVVGKHKEALNHCVEGVLTVENEQNQQTEIYLRAYREGVAFRLSTQFAEAVDLMEETTTIELPTDDLKLWAGSDRGVMEKPFTHSYEFKFHHKQLSDFTDSSFVHTPLAFETKNHVGIITEANVKSYPHWYLKPEASGFSSINTPLPGTDVLLKNTKQITTPWRVVMIADDFSNFINSDLITNLCEPLVIEKTDWIQAGKGAWDWWNDYEVDVENPGKNQETMKAYIDFAAKNNLEYMLIDSFWYGDEMDTTLSILQTTDSLDMPELVQYATDCGVGLHLWVNWKNMSKQYKEALPLYKKWGIKGIKMDFMKRDDAEMVDFYHEILQAAADNELMVNLHGCYKPTGIRRTYPNLVTREAVLGLEYYKWDEQAGPEHAVTAPYIRQIIGPMDYTPGGFRQVKEENFEARFHAPLVLGTRAHQLAMFVVFESPFQTVADGPKAFENQKGLDFIAQVPATWDETKFLSGKIGESIVLARRSGKDWYIGGMVGNEAKEVELKFDFLKKGVAYKISLWEDASTSEDQPTDCQEIKLDKLPELMKIKMVKGGGFVAVISPSTSNEMIAEQ